MMGRSDALSIAQSAHLLFDWQDPTIMKNTEISRLTSDELLALWHEIEPGAEFSYAEEAILAEIERRGLAPYLLR